MCRWSGACWVDAVREDCQYVYHSALVGKMTFLMTETLNAYGSFLSTTLYITHKWFLTVKVKFHLFNSPFHLSSTDIVAPAGLLSWLACGWKKQGRLTSVNLSTSTSFSWLWLWKEEYLYSPHGDTEKYASPLTTLLLSYDLPQIHYWSSLSVATELPQLSTDIHAGLQGSFHVQLTRNKSVFDKKAVCAAEVVLSTHWGHLTGFLVSVICRVKKVYEITLGKLSARH